MRAARYATQLPLLEVPRLEFERRVDALDKSLGRDGAKVDVTLAASELVAVWGALATLATAVNVATTLTTPKEGA